MHETQDTNKRIILQFIVRKYVKVMWNGFDYLNTGAHRREGEAAGLQPPPPKPKFKITDFVGIMISKVLRGFPFS